MTCSFVPTGGHGARPAAIPCRREHMKAVHRDQQIGRYLIKSIAFFSKERPDELDRSVHVLCQLPT